MLAKLEVAYVIVGHSERRQLFGETDDHVNRKVKAVLRHAMTPIVCVGETLEEREAGHDRRPGEWPDPGAFAGVERQRGRRPLRRLRADLGDRDRPQRHAPTTPTPPSPSSGATLRELYGDAADAMRILYGGSVKPGNVAELMAMPEIDGALVGGASLDPDDFARIVRYQA